MKPRRWTEEQLKTAAKKSTSVRQVLHLLGLKEAGGNYSQIRKFLDFYKVDTTHFRGPGWSKGMRGIGKPRIPLENILVESSTYQSYKLKKRLYSAGLKLPKCEECGWAKQNDDGYLPPELDHINGNHTDNRIENLRVLCPNCHSLKSNHRGRNIKNKK